MMKFSQGYPPLFNNPLRNVWVGVRAQGLMNELTRLN